MVKRDYYEVLGVERNATEEDLKKSYRKLARQFHPDTCGDQEKKVAEEKFKEISEAYAILSDQEKRRRYDTFGHTDGAGALKASAAAASETFSTTSLTIFSEDAREDAEPHAVLTLNTI